MEQTFPREIKMDFILFMISSMALFGGGGGRERLAFCAHQQFDQGHRSRCGDVLVNTCSHRHCRMN